MNNISHNSTFLWHLSGVLEVGPLARGVFAARWNWTWKPLSVASGGAGVDLQTLLERGLGLQPCCQRTKDQRLAKGSEDRNLPDHCSSAGNTFAFFCLIP